MNTDHGELSALCPACGRVPLLVHVSDAQPTAERARTILRVGFCQCRCRHCGLSLARDIDGMWIHLANDQPSCRNGGTAAEPADPATPPPQETL